MSEASQSAHVRIVLADYAVGDDKGKMTLVGAGVSIFSGVNPETGATPPFGVWASVTFAPELVGYNAAVELSLETEHGDLVKVPLVVDGQPQQRPLRVASSESLPTTAVPGVNIPGHIARPKVQMVLQFQTGLKLDPGHLYRWRVRVDGDTKDDWTEMMYVATASAPPAFG